MKPFTMHAVLKYRQQREDNARQRLHEALKREQDIQEKLQAQEQEIAALYQANELDQQQGTTVDRLVLFEHRITLVREQVEKLQERLRKQQQLVEQKRHALIAASKDRKIIEKIREQQNASYAAFLEKKEMAQLDEVAVLSHNHPERKQ